MSATERLGIRERSEDGGFGGCQMTSTYGERDGETKGRYGGARQDLIMSPDLSFAAVERHEGRRLACIYGRQTAERFWLLRTEDEVPAA